MVEDISAEQLDEVIAEHKVVFVDCHAIWCGPCKVLGPILEEIDEKFREKGLRVVKIDVDKNREFSIKHQISGVPAVIFYKDGQLVVFDDGSGRRLDKLVGVREIEVYEEIAEQLLSAEPEAAEA